MELEGTCDLRSCYLGWNMRLSVTSIWYWMKDVGINLAHVWEWILNGTWKELESTGNL